MDVSFNDNAKGNQRRPLNLTATSATLLPAVWLTQLLGDAVINLPSMLCEDQVSVLAVLGELYKLDFYRTSRIL
jgi:hypothetical protein